MSNNKPQADANEGAVCELRTHVDMAGITQLELIPESTLTDYCAAMQLSEQTS